MTELRIGFAAPVDEAVCRRFDSHFPQERLAGKIGARELILAREGDAPIGYLRLEYLWGQVPYIGLIWVAPPHRGAGFSECGILSGINPGGIGEVFFKKELVGDCQ